MTTVKRVVEENNRGESDKVFESHEILHEQLRNLQDIQERYADGVITILEAVRDVTAMARAMNFLVQRRTREVQQAWWSQLSPSQQAMLFDSPTLHETLKSFTRGF